MTVKGCCVIYSLFSVNTWVNPVATIGKTKRQRRFLHRPAMHVLTWKNKYPYWGFCSAVISKSEQYFRFGRASESRSQHSRQDGLLMLLCGLVCVWLCTDALVWSSWLPNLCCVWEIQTQLGGVDENPPKTLFLSNTEAQVHTNRCTTRSG